jgi:D-alanyl-D-alanine carboxypeptidase
MAFEASRLLESWVEQVGCFGASAAVRAPGRDDVFVAAGIDGRDPVTPMTTDRSFWIGSVTKTFTSAVVLLLVEDGLLALDDTLDRFSTVFPSSDAITIEMLLMHTAGVPDVLDGGDEYAALVFADLERVFTIDEAATIAAALPSTGAPGEEYCYSNTGYLILGSVIERVTNTAVGDVFERRLLAPLALAQTFLDPRRRDENLAHGWLTLDPGDPMGVDTLSFPHAAARSIAGTAGGMVSSLDDLLTWTTALYGGAFCAPLRDRLFASTRRPVSPDNIHGYGVHRFEHAVGGDGTIELYGHMGNLPGASAIVLYFPDTSVAVVAHANVQEVDDDQFAELATGLQALVT